MATQIIDNLVTKLGFQTDQAQLQRIRQRFDELKNRLQGLATQMTIAGAALTGALYKVGATVFGFEKSQNQLQATLSLTADGMKGLREQSLLLGRTTRFTAGEVTMAQNSLAQMGFTVEEVMGMTPQVLNLAAAGSMAMADAANLVAVNMRSFGLETAEAARVTDVLAKLATLTSTSVQELSSPFRQLGTAPSLMGQSLEQTAAMVGVLRNAGLLPEQAGTGLRNVFGRMARMSNDESMQTAMKEMGMSVEQIEQLSQLVTEGKMVEALRLLGKTVLDASKGPVAYANAMKLFEAEAGTVGLVLAKNTELLLELEAALLDAEGAAEKMRKTQGQGIVGAIYNFQSALEGLQLSLGEAGLTKVVTSAAEEITGLIGWLTNLPGEIRSVAAAALLAGPALTALGLALTGMKFALGGLAVLASPVVAIIVLVAVLAIAVLAWDQLTAAATSFWTFLKNTAIFGPLIEDLEGLQAWFADNDLVKSIADLWGTLSKPVEASTDEGSWNRMFGNILTAVTNLDKLLGLVLTPELDADEVTWVALGTAALGYIDQFLKGLAVKLLPELDADEVTWVALGTAALGYIDQFLKGLAVKLLPELDESENVWDSVGQSLLDQVGGMGEQAIFDLVPELDESAVTWMSVWTALRGRIVGSGKWLALLLFPELDETEVTWETVWGALRKAITLKANSFMLLLFPELDETEVTWETVWGALRKAITLKANSFMLLLFPELDETEVTWETVWGALRKAITLKANSFMLLLFPELDETEVTWETVWGALRKAITLKANSFMLLLFPELDETEVTWETVWGALRKAITLKANSFMLLLFPELDETEVTWETVWGALRKAITLKANSFMLLLFPELDETEVTWETVWGALRKAITLKANSFMLLLFPELDETEVTWETVSAAITSRIEGLGTALLLLLFPQLDETDITWETVKESVKTRIDGLAASLIAIIVPKLGLTEARAEEVQAQWNEWVSKWVSFDIDVKFGALQAFVNFWDSFRQSLAQEGFAESATTLLDALQGLLASLINMATTVVNSIGFDSITEFLAELGKLGGSGLATSIIVIADSLTALANVLSWFVDNTALATSAWLAFFQALNAETPRGETRAEQVSRSRVDPITGEGQEEYDAVNRFAGLGYGLGQARQKAVAATNEKYGVTSFEEDPETFINALQYESAMTAWEITKSMFESGVENVRNRPVTSGLFPGGNEPKTQTWEFSPGAIVINVPGANSQEIAANLGEALRQEFRNTVDNLDGAYVR